jgi:hypothetical protein
VGEALGVLALPDVAVEIVGDNGSIIVGAVEPPASLFSIRPNEHELLDDRRERCALLD